MPTLFDKPLSLRRGITVPPQGKFGKVSISNKTGEVVTHTESLDMSDKSNRDLIPLKQETEKTVTLRSAL